jgi:hypothetical protein
MEVRATQMEDLVVVHPDSDPVEIADPWHTMSLRLRASRNKT